MKHGDEKLMDLMVAGQVKADAAEQLCKLPKVEQANCSAKGPDAIRRKASDLSKNRRETIEKVKAEDAAAPSAKITRALSPAAEKFADLLRQTAAADTTYIRTVEGRQFVDDAAKVGFDSWFDFGREKIVVKDGEVKEIEGVFCLLTPVRRLLIASDKRHTFDVKVLRKRLADPNHNALDDGQLPTQPAPSAAELVDPPTLE